jgi:hypothetical protein
VRRHSPKRLPHARQETHSGSPNCGTRDPRFTNCAEQGRVTHRRGNTDGAVRTRPPTTPRREVGGGKDTTTCVAGARSFQRRKTPQAASPWDRRDCGHNTPAALQDSGAVPGAGRARLCAVSSASPAWPRARAGGACSTSTSAGNSRSSSLCSSRCRVIGARRAAFPGVEECAQAVQEALLSLVFNRGPSLSGDRRTEMRDPRPRCCQDWGAIPGRLRAMKRLCDRARPTPRREAEAAHIERTG